MVCLLLGIFTALGYFNMKGFVIDYLCGFMKSLIGYGYWLLPPALLWSAVILGFHRGRPVQPRVWCTMLLPVAFGGLLHLFHGLGGRAGPSGRLAGGAAGETLLPLLPHLRRHDAAGLILGRLAAFALALVLDLIVWFSFLCFGHGIASLKNVKVTFNEQYVF